MLSKMNSFEAIYLYAGKSDLRQHRFGRSSEKGLTEAEGYS